MDIREFKKWIIENHFEENDLFQEALICYNNRAYKAAYMFSYLAFTNYMRYLTAEKPRRISKEMCECLRS